MLKVKGKTVTQFVDTCSECIFADLVTSRLQ